MWFTEYSVVKRIRNNNSPSFKNAFILLSEFIAVKIKLLNAVCYQALALITILQRTNGVLCKSVESVSRLNYTFGTVLGRHATKS